MQVGFSFTFHGKVVPQMLGAYNILENSALIQPKPEYDK